MSPEWGIVILNVFDSVRMIPRFWYKSPIPSSELQSFLSTEYTSSRLLVGRISHTGRISIGSIPRPKIRSEDREYECIRPEHRYFQKCRWDWREGVVAEDVAVLIEKENVPPLGLSAVPNHHKPSRGRYGLRGITKNGRHKVLEGASLLHERYRGRLGFYTLTCPYKDSSLIYEFNRNIGEIMRRWFQELRRFYAKVKVTFSYVAVCEIQSERYQRTGVPVVHLHYVAPCYMPRSTKWVLGATEIRYLWMRCLASVLGVEADTSPSVDAQVVQTSASGYIAKYLSKGYEAVAWVGDCAPSQVPKQWWSMSANVRRCLRKLTTVLPAHLVEWWFGNNNYAEGDPYHLVYQQYIYVQWRGQELKVGMSAQISKEGRTKFIDPSTWLQCMWCL